MRFELHCHSTESDGAESPAAVVARAQTRAIDVFALTDHDRCTMAALPSARVLRGVEISCHEPTTGRTVHVLAYDRSNTGSAGWAALEAALAEVREARRHRLRTMAAKLEQRGVAIDVEALLAGAEGRTVGRPDLAKAMIAAGHATSFKDAFARHLFDGGPVDVPNRSLNLVDALALGRAAGAAMSLAHPHLYDHLSVKLLRAHKADGLAGVEAYYAAYDSRERARWIELADELDLVCTGGSDSHEPTTPHGVDLPPDRAARLVDWLGATHAPQSTQPSPK